MVDLQTLKDPSSATGAAPLQCDRAIFTSLPSRVGEGYRLVAWSGGVRAEERQELTRRAPSHGSLAGEADFARGLMLFHLQTSGRAVCGFVRVSGAEHTRRGGGRVWTDFVIGDAAANAATGLHPADLRAALAAATPPKPPIGSTLLEGFSASRLAAANPATRGAPAVARAAVTASLLLAGQPCVIAAGNAAADVLEDALHMIPAALRAGIDACAGLRFSPSRGVRITLTDRIDQDAIRSTRGQGVACMDLEKNAPALAGPLVPWLTLMSRWWNEERSGEAIELADRLAAGWSTDEIVHVASLCDAIDRGLARPETLDELLLRRSAA